MKKKPVDKIEIVWNRVTQVWDVIIYRDAVGKHEFEEPYLQDATDKVQRYMEEEDNWPE